MPLTLEGLEPLGATPIDAEELAGLIPQFITTRKELFDAEFKNINQALMHYFTSKRKFQFTLKNLYKTHQDMFKHIWKWAGKKRTTDKNIGIDWYQIDTELKKLIDDFEYWSKNAVDPLEVSARVHHRLVKIHPFHNGNGRWARFLTNLYLKQKTGSYIRWPEDALFIETSFRKQYIETLRQADQSNYDPLTQLHKKHLQ
jgi:Fic-DOC domain mobile mystery protein B